MDFTGDKNVLCYRLMQQGIESEEDANKIIEFLTNNRNILSNSEKFEIDVEYPDMPPGMMGLMIAEYTYYVNIKVTTIAIIALLLDINVTGGLAATLLSLGGASSRGIIKLNEFEGEKCIVKETLMQGVRIGNKDILLKFSGECCNNNMNCKYNDSGKCNCSENTVISIYEKLVEKDMFIKRGNEYVYQN